MESKTITINLGDADASDVKDIIVDALNNEGYDVEVNDAGDQITIKADEDEDDSDEEKSDKAEGE